MSTSYTPANSHDPKTDHRSLLYLVLFALFVFVAIAAAGGAFTPKTDWAEAKPYAEVDGCTVYRFDDEDGINYFATCGEDKVTTTYSKGSRHIMTHGTKR